MKTVNFQICYTTVLAVLLKQFVASDEFVIPREPTAKEIAACKVAREENLHVAPTWPKQFDLMTKMVQSMMEIDPAFRGYVEENFHLDNPEDELAKKVFALYTRRWLDFLNRISDNKRGDDGENFAEKWQADGRIIDLNQPSWVKSSIVSYVALMEKLLPTFHKDEFITCIKLHEDYVVE